MDTIQQEIEQEKQLSRMDDRNGEIKSIQGTYSQQCGKNRTTNDSDGAVVNIK